MKRLVEANLWGNSFFTVETRELISRYNECLERFGIASVSLDRFRVDGMGWSPEIAELLDNRHYLSAGVANPMAIIVSPDQANKPVYMPYHSFDQDLMDTYFQTYGRKIASVTASTCIGLEIDQDLSHYESPADLLLVQCVTVRSSAGELVEGFRHQNELVKRFSSNGLAWFDPALRQDIVASVEAHGDLRSRDIDIPDMTFSDLHCFHTHAFGGVFVLRDPHFKGGALIVEDSAHLPERTNLSASIHDLSDPNLVDHVLRARFATIDQSWYRNRRELLERKKECLIADVLCRADESLDYASLTSAQKKQRLNALDEGMPQLVSELERLLKKMESSHATALDNVSPQLKRLLMHPLPERPASERRVIQRLLCRLDSRDIFQLYASDRKHFVDLYSSWPQSKKSWAVSALGKTTTQGIG